jgi:RimJ/RimL family protein N-acetyltransferase
VETAALIEDSASRIATRSGNPGPRGGPAGWQDAAVLKIFMLTLTRSTIRPLCQSDAASLANYANNRKVWRNLRDLMPHPYALSDAEWYIGHVLESPRPTSFAIDVAGAAVGVIGVRLKEDIERIGAELGYWLGEPFWGQGILSEAVPAFTRWAIAEFQLTRVEAIVFEWNPASARVLEKAGFVYEGTLRRSAVKDGQVINRLMYAYLAEPAE